MLKYFQENFLPNYDSSTKYILSFFLFSIGYIGQPFGAYIFGKIGDTRGRKLTIALSIALLTISTSLIGCLPTYQQVGTLAPVLLIILRLLQNVAVSVEQIGGSIYLTESFPDRKRYTVSSFMFSTVYIGHILGLIVGLTLNLFCNTTEMLTWGWRIPFLLSFPIGVCTLYLRLKLVESPVFKACSINNNDVKLDFNKVVKSTLSFVSIASSSYLTIIYIPNMLHLNNTLSSIQVFGYACLVNLAVFIITLICGYYVDTKSMDGKKLQNYGLICNIFFALPIYYFLHIGTVQQIFLAQMLSALCLGLQAATILGCIYDDYNQKNRLFTLTMGYNFAMTFFGGISTFMIAYLATNVHYTAPAIYLILLSSTTLFIINDKALFFARKKPYQAL